MATTLTCFKLQRWRRSSPRKSKIWWTSGTKVTKDVTEWDWTMPLIAIGQPKYTLFHLKLRTTSFRRSTSANLRSLANSQALRSDREPRLLASLIPMKIFSSVISRTTTTLSHKRPSRQTIQGAQWSLMWRQVPKMKSTSSLKTKLDRYQTTCLSTSIFYQTKTMDLMSIR